MKVRNLWLKYKTGCQFWKPEYDPPFSDFGVDNQGMGRTEWGKTTDGLEMCRPSVSKDDVILVDIV